MPLVPELDPGDELPVEEPPALPELPLLLVPDDDEPVDVEPFTVLPGTVVEAVELPLPPGDDEPLELDPLDDVPADVVPVPDELARFVFFVVFAASTPPGRAVATAAAANPAKTPNAVRRVRER